MLRMARLTRLLLCLALLALGTLVPVQGRRVIRAAPGSATTGCFVVKLKDSATHEQFESALNQVIPLATEDKVYTKVEGEVSKMFTMKMSHDVANAVKNLDNVEYVEEETVAQGSQSCAMSWGRDRVDQTSPTLDCRYDPVDKGEGSDIYILDSGINFDHVEFEYRAKYPGYDPMDAYNAVNSPTTPRQQGRDCHGHGTHVSSLAVGNKSGTAPEAHAYSVRVLNCDNFGPWSVIIDGLNYAVRQIKASRKPSVISMSLSGGRFQAMDDAIRNAHSMGVTIVVAAGNARVSSCNSSPAGSPYVITVGGTARGDILYSSTNGGTCVDIFAPGAGISAAAHTCNTCTKTLSGTSMSTPLVSGVAAILLQRQPLLTPDQVKEKIINDSLKNVINFSRFPENLRNSSPNRLLHINGSCGGVHHVDNDQTLIIYSPNHPSSYPDCTECTWILTASQGRAIDLTFTEISLESNYDHVSVYNGYCKADNKILGSHSRSVSGRPHYQSSGNTLTVQLYTDCTISNRGFRAEVRSVPQRVDATTAPETAATSPETAATSPVTACPRILPTEATVTSPANCNLTQSLDGFKANLLKTMEGILVDGIQYVANLAQKPCNESQDSNSTVPPLNTIINIGLRPESPADSCQALHNLKSYLQSGFYWVKQANSQPVHVYCEMEKNFPGDQSRGWARIANFDMTNTSVTCPGELRLVNQARRSCGRGQQEAGCSSAFFSTQGIQYSKVCGRVRGYQYSSPNAFFWYSRNPQTLTINDNYVDGAILTYNSNSGRNHIWTLAAALDEVKRPQQFSCPCTVPDNSTFLIPPFVGNDYFCETGSRDTFQYDRFYQEDPLWDAAGCGSRSTCCQRGPFFCKTLPSATTSRIELRVCGNEVLTNEDTPIELVELYVQ